MAAAPLVGANIATDRPGLSAGAAQIFDTKPLEDRLQAQIDAERKRQALQNQFNQEELSKIDLNGIRTSDQNVVTQKYNDAYQAFTKLQLAQANNDRNGQVQAQSELNQAQLDAKSLAAKSKTDNTNYALQLADYMHNRDHYIDGTDKALQAWKNTPITDPNYGQVSDLTNFVKEPPKVDLMAVFDKAAVDGTNQITPHVVKDSGAKFDVTGTTLPFSLFAKNVALSYTGNHDIEDAVRKQYDPSKFTPEQQAHVQQLESTVDPATGKPIGPLTTPDQIAAADYWASNQSHFNKIERKQVTEKTPRAAAPVINFGMGGNDASGTINIAQPGTTQTVPQKDASGNVKKDANGKPIMATITTPNNSTSTAVNSFTLNKPIRVDIPNSPSIRDNNKGTALQGNGVQTLVGSQIAVRPVYKTGPNAGNIVPDNDKDNAISNGTASYQIVFHANQGNVVGMSQDGSQFTFSKDPTPVYAPAGNAVVQAIINNTPKDKLPAVQAELVGLQAQVQKLNAGQPQSGFKLKKTAGSWFK